MAEARGSKVSVDLGCNHDSGDSESVAQQVFKQLDKNPLLTAKPLCQILRLEYRDRGHYVRNLKTKWKYHHRNERGSIRSLPDSVHCAFWVGVLPGGLESGIRADAIGSGWLLSRARNRFLLWRDSFGRVRWFENGNVELYVRKPASDGKAMQLFSRAFVNSGLARFSDNFELARFLDCFARSLRHRGAHAVYESDQRLPYMKITTFWDTNGFMVVTGDRTNPRGVEVIYKYQDQIRKADELITAFLEGLGVKSQNGTVKRGDPDYVS